MDQTNSWIIFVLLLSNIVLLSSGRVLDDQLIKKFTFNNNGFGTYSFEFESADGTYRKEDGGLVTGAHGNVLVVKGEYGYINPDGFKYSVHYVADENGFQPQPEDTRFNDRRLT